MPQRPRLSIQCVFHSIEQRRLTMASDWQEDILSLRQHAQQHPAVRALPNGYISRNDIIVAIAWLLGCDMHQRRRPGYAVAGTANVALLILDLVDNDLDRKLTHALVPPGTLWLSHNLMHALLA